MTRFTSREQAASVFTTLFEILLEDERFATTVRREQLSVQFFHSDPDLTIFVSADGVWVDETPMAPTISIKMSCETADALWSGRLLMPIALGTGKIRIKGSVAKVIEFVPLLQPAFDQYSAIAAEAGARTGR